MNKIVGMVDVFINGEYYCSLSPLDELIQAEDEDASVKAYLIGIEACAPSDIITLAYRKI